MQLKEKHCKPCEEGTKPFTKEETEKFAKQIGPGWKVIDNKKLRQKFPFDNFKRGMAFAQDIAIIAEEENHHPDLCIHYSNVEVELSTHKIGGLSENDFILASKIQAI